MHKTFYLIYPIFYKNIRDTLSGSLFLMQTVNMRNMGHLWQNLAKDEYESNFISAVVPPGEIGIKFEDIGALEDVKTALHELAILPMQRPELFSRGNLLRVLCFFS